MSRLSPRIALLMTVAPLLWAGNAVVGRLLVGSVPPLTLNFLRWLLAGLILLPWVWRAWQRPHEISARWKHLLPLGLLGVGSYNALQYMALVTSTPINVTLIAASLPVWMMVVGLLAYGERPTPGQALGTLLSFAGVLLVISRGDPAALAQLRFVRGDLFVIGAAITWAVYSWMMARPPASMRPPERPDWDWKETLSVQLAFGLLGSGAAAGVEQAFDAAPIAWSGWVVAALLYVALGPSILAFRSWSVGVAQCGPALAAFFGNLTPLFATLLSAAVLGEAPHWFHAVAFLLIVGGILVSTRPPAPRRPESPERSAYEIAQRR